MMVMITKMMVKIVMIIMITMTTMIIMLIVEIMMRTKMAIISRTLSLLSTLYGIEKKWRSGKKKKSYCTSFL